MILLHIRVLFPLHLQKPNEIPAQRVNSRRHSNSESYFRLQSRTLGLSIGIKSWTRSIVHVLTSLQFRVSNEKGIAVRRKCA